MAEPTELEHLLVEILRGFHLPNPENPRDFLIAPGRQKAVSRAVGQAYLAIGSRIDERCQRERGKLVFPADAASRSDKELRALGMVSVHSDAWKKQ